MSKIAVNPQTQTMRQLLANGLEYRTPPFQRNYAWQEEQWSELWEDILQLPERQGHYMGYLVLQSGDHRRFNIVDGQQRLATLSILALAARWWLDDLIERGVNGEKNEAHREGIFRGLVKIYDPETAKERVKLSLNRADNDFYRRLARFEFPPSKSLQQKSARRMWGAFDFFKEKLGEHFNPMDGDALARFFNSHLLDGLFFTALQVTNDEDAYTVFETLNSRGVELSGADLVKNLLFSRIIGNRQADSEEFRETQDTWDGILNAVGGRDVTTFLRHYWNSCEESVEKTGLYSALRGKINQGDESDAVHFLRRLRRNAEMYRLFIEPDVDDWQPGQKKELRRLALYGNVTGRHYPLLLAAFRQWEKSEEFTRVLRFCAALIFRGLVVGGLGAGALGRACQTAALKIERGEARRAREILPVLQPAYLDDKVFAAAFAALETSKRKMKLIRHILTVLENEVSAAPAIDENDGKMTVEHILPQSPQTEGGEFPATEYHRFLWRLGNLTLLKMQDNNRCSDKAYEEKREVYRCSGYRITAGCADKHREWNPNALTNRQEWMAKKAAQIWRIDFGA